MNILVTLNSGLGADTGPNFNLTADVGSVTPSTATKGELLAGKFVDVNASATQITVTSTGTCTTSIVLNIVGQTTTTTTSAASSFVLGYDVSNFFTACVDYGVSPTTVYSTTAATLGVGVVLYSNPSLSTFAVDGYYSDGTNWWRVNFGSGIIVSTGSCTTTTSTTSTTSTSTSTTSTSTSTTSTSTTLAPISFNLGYDASVGWQACYSATSVYYRAAGEILENGTYIYTDSILATPPADGYYSDGANYWNVISGELTSETPCPTTSTTSTTSTSTSTTSTSTTSTSTSTSSTTSTTTEPPTSTTTSTSTTTEPPTSTTTSTSSTTSTTTIPLPPGETSTTTTSTTEPPTTTTSTSTSTSTSTTEPPTTTTSTSTTTTTTTEAPQCNYDGLSIVCDSTTTTTTTEPLTTTTTTLASATLDWSFSETGGAVGTMDLYVNGSIIETRMSTSSGTYTVYVGDTINVELSINQCTGGGSTYSNVYTSGIINEADCTNNGTANLFTAVYTVVSGDIGNTLSLDTFASCDGACI